MNQYKYLRAYMAGIVVPTIVLILGVTAFCIARYAYNFSDPLERLMIFPMAVVPNLWGLWNMLFIASHSRTHLPIGIHGAIATLYTWPARHSSNEPLAFFHPGLRLALFSDHRTARPDRLLPALEIRSRLPQSRRQPCLNSTRSACPHGQVLECANNAIWHCAVALCATTVCAHRSSPAGAKTAHIAKLRRNYVDQAANSA